MQIIKRKTKLVKICLCATDHIIEKFANLAILHACLRILKYQNSRVCVCLHAQMCHFWHVVKNKVACHSNRQIE